MRMRPKSMATVVVVLAATLDGVVDADGHRGHGRLGRERRDLGDGAARRWSCRRRSRRR